MKLNKAVPALVVCSILAALPAAVHVSARVPADPASSAAAVAPGASANASIVPADREFLTLKRDLVISGNAGDDGTIASITDLMVDVRGRIYVVDILDRKVKVFGADGSFILSFGKKGQGPGEFQAPNRIVMGKDGNLSVHDYGRRRIFRFSPEGVFIGDRDIRKAGGDVFMVDGENEETVYGVRLNVGFPDSISSEEFVRFDKRTGAARIIARFEYEYSQTRRALMHQHYRSAVGSNGLVWACTDKYELFLESPSGNRTGVITREYHRTRVTEREKEKFLKGVQSNRGGTPNIPKGVTYIFPEYHYPIEGLIVDDKDWIYVLTSEKDGEGRSRHDVFDAACVYRGSFHFGSGDILEIRDGRAYVRAEDEDGNPVIERYVMTPAK